MKKDTANFRPINLKRIEHGLTIFVIFILNPLDMNIHQVAPNMPIKTLSKSRLSDRFFGYF